MTAAIQGMLQGLGSCALERLRRCGNAALFCVAMLRVLPAALARPRLVLVQVHVIGNRSITIIAASGLAVGCVLALQMYHALAPFGAVDSLGLVVNLALVRELGPVISGLLFAGRAGTSLTAEIGLMKAGEQLAAMELMAIDPKRRLLAPRLIGGMFAMPLLAFMFSAIGVWGAYLVAVPLLGIDAGSFWSLMEAGVDPLRDIGSGALKSAVFGAICALVALYQGSGSAPTPEGVALATTRTVVLSSLWILGVDFVLTALMFSVP
ncbi:lipid asymmetry maintenance ABC transporter permease subunit MlaE [Pseudoduganella umbonata]|uniref:Intermembrane phospholipid transport system permease protein MlaE n=1 Tax=Pseudoduganella umbonata TaxID=864828 RepID=A0A4P8HX90_9BURK|nr:lipid asymmetry maintenance ABC transporter permease subunit MlaE [Pseudoduganella umbonata]MBB3224100.1 phospholipid/cholesterol/gamma-HCH transport system permease protein [Pseudoduganella umbonata]QCP14036.1 lipid asymmetry maintenance ABC transporter permease subunit MlaE [Pseudoduganella umbonata]